MRYDDLSQLREEDCNYMSEFFFTDLLQKLESEFVPNHFNPEINILELTQLTPTQVSHVIFFFSVRFCLPSAVEMYSRPKKDLFVNAKILHFELYLYDF